MEYFIDGITGELLEVKVLGKNLTLLTIDDLFGEDSENSIKLIYYYGALDSKLHGRIISFKTKREGIFGTIIEQEVEGYGFYHHTGKLKKHEAIKIVDKYRKSINVKNI